MEAKSYLATEGDSQGLLPVSRNNELATKQRGKFIIIIVLVLLLLGLTTFTIYYVVDNESDSSETTTTNICETEACYKLSADKLRSVNFSRDPCENFWNYACDGWWDENNFELIKRPYFASTTKLNIYQEKHI